MAHIRNRPGRSHSGQAMVEFALILPLFVSVLLGVIVLGILVFYNQQLTNATREAARFASVHSATAQCSVVSTLDPAGAGLTSTDPITGHTAAWGAPTSYARCDRAPWPQMAAYGRSQVFGLNTSAVYFSACWSGYRTLTQYDAPPPGTYIINGNSTVIDSSWTPCSIGGSDPTANASAIACSSGLATVDTASDISEGQGRIAANRVTVYACYQWSPPGAGFLLIPQTITLRAVISEPIQRQQ
jgi:TadE-like protein